MISEPDLEQDLLKNDYIANKCIHSDIYAQNLYAALCDNRFFFNDKEWTCSWRYAAGLVASLVDTNGNYMDYYCSGSTIKGYVFEGSVTDEIRYDLVKLGWTIKPYDNKYYGVYGYKQMQDGSILPYPIDTQLPKNENIQK